MTIAYVTFMKHAQKVAKTVSASRPVLKGVHHAPDGSLVVTDSHRLYLAKGLHTNEAGEITDPKTGAVIEGNYPDVSRLIPDAGDAKYVARIMVDEAVNAFAALLKVNHAHSKKTDIMTTVTPAGTDDLEFTVSNSILNVTYKPVCVVDGNGDAMMFNTQYFAESLAMFKDAGVTEVTMRYHGSFRPFTLSAGQDDELLALILPIRRAAD